MKYSIKCLIATTFVAAFSIPSALYAGHSIGSHKVTGTIWQDRTRDNLCQHTGYTWYAGGSVYGQIDTWCERRTHTLLQGVKVYTFSGRSSSLSLGNAYYTRGAWRKTSGVKCSGNSRSLWGVKHTFGDANTQFRMGSPFLLDYHNCG